MANSKTIDDNEILRLSLIGLEQQLANTKPLFPEFGRG